MELETSAPYPRSSVDGRRKAIGRRQKRFLLDIGIGRRKLGRKDSLFITNYQDSLASCIVLKDRGAVCGSMAS
jgi:hypothetical protein